MKRLLEAGSLFRKILLSFVLASVFFLSLLSLVVYYSNEKLEDDLLATQMDFELNNILELLAKNPQARLPRSASLHIYLDSRRDTEPLPAYLEGLEDGVHHDIKLADKAYHILVAPRGDDRIYIQYDVTEIENSEALLGLILLIAWIVLIVIVIFIAWILGKKLSEPIHRLSQALDGLNPDQRGVQLSDQFEDDEVGKIAQAFDTYSQKLDGYVEKQIAFAAMASHELRSPLTIVQTSADLIASRREDASVMPHLDKIQRATANMSQIIHALLAVTRDQPARDGASEVCLRPLVDDILEAVSPETRGRQIEISNELAPDAVVNADPTLLSVVLSNLVRNGVKHGEKSSIVISMQANRLRIVDNGMGLDGDELEAMFDFAARGQRSQGYGIGLYISRLVCEHQGWRLGLEANEAGGCTATIDFAA